MERMNVDGGWRREDDMGDGEGRMSVDGVDEGRMREG